MGHRKGDGDGIEVRFHGKIFQVLLLYESNIGSHCKKIPRLNEKTKDGQHISWLLQDVGESAGAHFHLDAC